MHRTEIIPQPSFLTPPEYAKAIGIILVVFGHALRGLIAADVLPESVLWDNVDRAIYLFHMPLFFYLSGLFIEENFRRKGAGSLISKYAAILLIPLFIWSYFQFSLQYMASSSVNNAPDMLGVVLAPFPPKQQFWFLGALFLTVSFVAAIFRLSGKKYILLSVLLMCAVVSVFVPEGFLIPVMADNHWINLLGHTYLHLPYFILGIFIGPAILQSLKMNIILCVFLFCLSLATYLLFQDAPDILRFGASIVCVLTFYKAMVHVAEILPRWSSSIDKVFLFIGFNSMIIYLAHVIASAGTRVILLKLGIEDISLHLTIGTAAGIIAPLSLVYPSVYIGQKYPFFSQYIVPAKLSRA